VPAAGTGSRLKSASPKFLVPVLGRPMIDWLVELYEPYVDRLVAVVSPPALGLARAHRWPDRLPVDLLVQERPTGMLDAVMLAEGVVRESDAAQVIVTWCDQVAVGPATVARLVATFDANRDAGIVMPTCVRPRPYIHFDRDDQGRIVQVSQRREGHAMPDEGESDAGLFLFARTVFLDRLREYSRAAADGEGTGERNLLPFIPWMARRGSVVTFPCAHEMEAVGVNTPEELRAVERYLAPRDASR
jgi:bifunctional N-acetylglucosamine-1-phosphate-uridyltransferase/glucosamine-1-phosphate-acetyltransferase GlmU-like protein